MNLNNRKKGLLSIYSNNFTVERKQKDTQKGLQSANHIIYRPILFLWPQIVLRLCVLCMCGCCLVHELDDCLLWKLNDISNSIPILTCVHVLLSRCHRASFSPSNRDLTAQGIVSQLFEYGFVTGLGLASLWLPALLAVVSGFMSGCTLCWNVWPLH